MKEPFDNLLAGNLLAKHQQHCPLFAIMLAMGSNHNANDNLAHARMMLKQLGETVFSSLLVNADYTATTAQPKPDYTNQCGIVVPYTPINLHTVNQQLKKFESHQHRHHACHQRLGRVTIDIDVLAVRLAMPDDRQNHQGINFAKWLFIPNRLPLKSHECHGVRELIAQDYLSSITVSSSADNF